MKTQGPRATLLPQTAPLPWPINDSRTSNRFKETFSSKIRNQSKLTGPTKTEESSANLPNTTRRPRSLNLQPINVLARNQLPMTTPTVSVGLTNVVGIANKINEPQLNELQTVLRNWKKKLHEKLKNAILKQTLDKTEFTFESADLDNVRFVLTPNNSGWDLHIEASNQSLRACMREELASLTDALDDKGVTTVEILSKL